MREWGEGHRNQRLTTVVNIPQALQGVTLFPEDVLIQSGFPL